MEKTVNKLAKIKQNNVFFKTVVCPFSEVDSKYHDFMDEFGNGGLTKNGQFFFSVDDIYEIENKEDLQFKITYYQPAEERGVPQDCDLKYIDAIYYDHMLYRVIEGNDLSKANRVYLDIIEEAKAQGKNINSPFFHEYAVGKDKEGNVKTACIIKARMV